MKAIPSGRKCARMPACARQWQGGKRIFRPASTMTPSLLLDSLCAFINRNTTGSDVYREKAAYPVNKSDMQIK